MNGGDYSDPTKRVIYAMSHDEARNGSHYLMTEFGGRGSWDARAKTRAASALMLMSPGIAMIWQGEEFAQDGEFNDKRENAVNWAYERDIDGSRMKALYKDAIKRRWEYQSLSNRESQRRWPCIIPIQIISDPSCRPLPKSFGNGTGRFGFR